jgi:hypothetical protein
VIVTVPAQDVTICQRRRRQCRTSSRTATAHTRSTANARQLSSAHPADPTEAARRGGMGVGGGGSCNETGEDEPTCSTHTLCKLSNSFTNAVHMSGTCSGPEANSCARTLLMLLLLLAVCCCCCCCLLYAAAAAAC